MSGFVHVIQFVYLKIGLPENKFRSKYTNGLLHASTKSLRASQFYRQPLPQTLYPRTIHSSPIIFLIHFS